MQRAISANPLRRLTLTCSTLARRQGPRPPVSPTSSYVCHASGASSQRWQIRQGGDKYAKEAKLQGLKSRAAFKLLEINYRFKFFKAGQTVVDLGYAPGSWSQVAVDRTHPTGRVIGIDIIPAQPPRGVSTIQGNFLSPAVQAEVRRYVQDPDRGRPRSKKFFSETDQGEASMTSEDLEASSKGYVDLEREVLGTEHDAPAHDAKGIVDEQVEGFKSDATVDVVLSDMMMNTSGNAFRDHAGSMDLCDAALRFAFDTLKTGGTFVCKFYQGGEDKLLERRLKVMFSKVHREKPESSRSESKEAYFVALRRKAGVQRSMIWQNE